MLDTVNEYMARSRRLWDEALAEIDGGNAVQASEKLWGAAAQAVKAVAEARGWSHRSHRELYEVVGRLQQDNGHQRLGELFGVANALHQNFYEWWMPLEEVRRRAPNIQELRQELYALMEPPPG